MIDYCFVLPPPPHTRFQGYLCKLGGVLASEYDLVASVDVDAVVMENVFNLMDTDIFQRTGTYLFRVS